MCGLWRVLLKSNTQMEKRVRIKKRMKDEKKQHSTDKSKATKNCCLFRLNPTQNFSRLFYIVWIVWLLQEEQEEKDRRNMIIITPIKKSLMLNETHWSSSRIPFGSGQRTNKPVKIITNHHNSCRISPPPIFASNLYFCCEFVLFFSTWRLKNIFFSTWPIPKLCAFFSHVVATYMSRNYVCVLFLSEKNRISYVMVLTKRMSHTYARTHARTRAHYNGVSDTRSLELFFRSIECQSINGNSMNKGNRRNPKHTKI